MDISVAKSSTAQRPHPTSSRSSLLSNSRSTNPQNPTATATKRNRSSPTEAQLTRLLTLYPFSASSTLFLLWYRLTTNLSNSTVASLHNAVFASSISAKGTIRATEWNIVDVAAHGTLIVDSGSLGGATLQPPDTVARCPCHFGINCATEGLKKRREMSQKERADMVRAARIWSSGSDEELLACPEGWTRESPKPGAVGIDIWGNRRLSPKSSWCWPWRKSDDCTNKGNITRDNTVQASSFAALSTPSRTIRPSILSRSLCALLSLDLTISITLFIVLFALLLLYSVLGIPPPPVPPFLKSLFAPVPSPHDATISTMNTWEARTHRVETVWLWTGWLCISFAAAAVGMAEMRWIVRKSGWGRKAEIVKDSNGHGEEEGHGDDNGIDGHGAWMRGALG